MASWLHFRNVPHDNVILSGASHDTTNVMCVFKTFFKKLWHRLAHLVLETSGPPRLPLSLSSGKRPGPLGRRCPSGPFAPGRPRWPPWKRCSPSELQVRRADESRWHFLLFTEFTFWDNLKPLTFLAVNLKVCRGGVVVHVMLVDLFVEALSLL